MFTIYLQVSSFYRHSLNTKVPLSLGVAVGKPAKLTMSDLRPVYPQPSLQSNYKYLIKNVPMNISAIC